MRRLYEFEWRGLNVLVWIYQVKPMVENWAAAGDILFHSDTGGWTMIRKLKTGEFRIYSRHQDPKTKRRKNLGTFATREKAEEHERAIQYFKRHWCVEKYG
jgi:hypothetical protein